MERERDIEFVVEGGCLRPSTPVDMPEGTKGIARIRDTGDDEQASRKAMEIIRRFSEARVFDSQGRKMTRDEMHERR